MLANVARRALRAFQGGSEAKQRENIELRKVTPSSIFRVFLQPP
jgi:hypothetical protein